MVALPRGMEHVDRKELYTSLPARVHYLHQFLEFSADDVAALIDGHRYIRTVIPAIVNMVYKKLLKHDITARVFTQRDSRSEVDPDTWVSEDSAQIQHRKMFLRWYLTKLNSDPTKMEYWEYLDKVGLMHVGLGRRNPLHVDYIFLGACLGYIQDAMTEAILSHPTLDLTRKIAIVKAIGKVIWIQNDLLAKWHVHDGEEFQDSFGAEEVKLEAAEPEGYLHGKKVLGEKEPNSGDEASVRSSSSGKTSLGRNIEELEGKQSMDQSRCPFSGMAMGGQRAEPMRVSKTKKDPLRPQPAPSGIPRLYVVDGKTVCKEKLDPNPFEPDAPYIGQAL
ncbi:uncharacterized protein HMPREF1541_09382 [Cyphellophora europaea CBS 101466]|uniref:Globin-sensor domain-containing protein n=1 Tax=Cyphellophora europaea (strain CBS 101466) TaxID=1220924 RepID=W2SA90_CYPE1|nr:uncharacterized protein HMPREF1541_09382 [Cyphellophora europaea CBS 101466]ETN45550.1 hypothetical protein HMPREF1541_09382 [Cyphellophora europaea CBS 101466]